MNEDNADANLHISPSPEDISPLDQHIETRVQQRTQALLCENKALRSELSSKHSIEQSLTQSKHFLREAAQIARLGRWEYSIQTNQVTYSEDLLQIFSLPQDHDWFCMDTIKNFVHPEDIERILQEYYRLKTEGGSSEFDFRIVLQENRTIYVHHITSTTIENGRVTKISGIMQDVTKQKLTEEAYAKSIEKFKSIFENIQDIYFIVERNGMISEVSPSVTRYIGKTREQIINTHISDGYLFDLKEARQVFRLVFREKEIFDYELRLIGIGGILLYTSFNAHLILDAKGKLLRIEGTIRDITDRKAAENALRTKVQVEEFISLLSARFIAMSLSEFDCEISRALEQICNFTSADFSQIFLIGSATHENRTGFYTSTSDGFKDQYKVQTRLAPLLERLLESHSERQSDFVFRAGKFLRNNVNQGELTALLRESGVGSAVFIAMRSGKTILGCFCIYCRQDSPDWMHSDLSYLDLAVKIFTSALERKRVEEELMIAKNIAEKSSRIKEEFLAHMSHEFRTPLNAIIGSTYLLLKTKPEPKQLEYIESIRISSDNLLALVNDMLDFSKIRAGKIEFECVKFSPVQLTEQIFKIAKINADGKFLSLILDSAPDVPLHVLGDAARFNQIMMNLISNAVKFTENGEVRAVIRAKSLPENKVRLQIQVRDTGIGIPSDELNTIFQDFMQGSNNGSKKVSGTGLGLTICRKLVELQGGVISATSTPHRGSVFSFHLDFPIASAETSEVKAQEKWFAIGSLKGVRALLVEDNEFNLLVLRDLMQLWKASFKVATDGKKALVLLRKYEFDLILLDIGLPEMNGYELAAYIRHNLPEKKRRVPIIALTAAASSTEKMMALQSGMNDYISKPFDEWILFEKIVQLAGPIQSSSAPVRDRQNRSKGQALTGKYFKPRLLLKERRITPAFLSEIIDSFFENAPMTLVELERQLATKDYTALKKAAHKAKSMYSYLHLRMPAKLLSELEEFTGSGASIQQLESKMASLREMTEVIFSEMNDTKNYFQENTP